MAVGTGLGYSPEIAGFESSRNGLDMVHTAKIKKEWYSICL